MEKTKNKVIFSRKDSEDMRNEETLIDAIEIIEDKEDYTSAIKVKLKNKKWTSHSELKEAIGSL